MKKRIIFAALLVAALTFGTISCTKEETKLVVPGHCWKLTFTVEVSGYVTTKDLYAWGTEEDIDAKIAKAKADSEAKGITTTVTKEPATQFTTVNDCEAQNPKE